MTTEKAPALSTQRPSAREELKQKLLADVTDNPPIMRLNCQVDAHLYRQIKTAAFERGSTVSEMTRQFWLRYLRKRSKNDRAEQHSDT